MAQYRQDRFKGFGLTLMRSEGTMLASQQAPEAMAYTVSKESSYMLNRAALLAPMAVATTTTPAKTEQQKAEEELAALQQQAEVVQTEAAVEEALDFGEPKKTSPLVYVGVGVGALVLIGGVLLATKKKSGKKVAGYRRRKRR